MALAPGTRLGPYEILSPLGAGGMGEVFRARDTRLGRDVAVKVLPDHLASDPGALARFESEARTVAALSHPSILALYDVGEASGLRYAVSELLEGEALRALVLRGPVPVRRALEVVAHVADALAAAHGKGIVHRDVKPENVFLTKDGYTKVLDFGLAHRTVTPLSPEETRSPTEPVLTSPGTVLGTVAYMAPEQARGLPADHRSDQFSLGVALYEMLAGRRPFKGASGPELLTAILREEPAPLDTLAPATPLPVRLLVDRLLSKDPADRWDSTRDLARDLATWRQHLSERTVRGMNRSGRVTRLPARRRPLRVALALAAVAGLATLGLFIARPGRAPEPRPPGFDRFERLTFQPGVESDPALSPDGTTLAFSRAGDVWVQRVGGRNPTNLTADHPGYDGEPAWSPDGLRIAFRSERDGGGVFVMGATGESVRRVSTWGRSPDWYPDGRRLVASCCVGTPYSVDPLETGLRAIDLETGATRLLADVYAFDPRVSPSGLRVAFSAVRPGDFRRDVYTVPAEAGERPERPFPVTADAAVDWNPFWSPDGGSLLFASDRSGTMNLWRVAVDEPTGRPSGPLEPQPVPALFASGFAGSRASDRVAYASAESVTTIERIAFDPAAENVQGPPEILHRTSTGLGNLRISPRGDLLVFNTFGRSDLWILRVDGTGLRQVTDDPTRDYFPSFSPDGRRLAFQSDRGGSVGVWIIDADGSSPACVAVDSAPVGWPAFSPDGRTIAVHSKTGLRLLPADARCGAPLPPARPGLPDGRQLLPDSWSPDGRLLSGLLVRPDGTRGGVATWDPERERYSVVSQTGGRSAFLSDGRRLLVADGGALVLVDTADLRRKVVVPAESGRRTSFPSVAPDDRTLYLVRVEAQADIWLASRTGGR